jgi:hypothetical protein
MPETANYPEFVYRDDDLQPTDRVHAVYDHYMRRMDQCIQPECEGTPRHYLCTIDGKEMHTRLCGEHLWSARMRDEYNLRPDPEMS